MDRRSHSGPTSVDQSSDHQPARVPLHLRSWILRAFIRVSVIPSMVLLVAFFTIYLLANHWSYQASVGYMGEHVEESLSEMARLEAKGINQALSSIDHTAELFRYQAAQALATEHSFQNEDSARLAYSPDGAYFTTQDKPSGGVAIFYSGFVPVSATERDKVARSLALEPLMKNIITAEPLSASIYLNTHDSLNIIYPYFDVIDQYPARMDIPAYNFYYEADATHNPERSVRWTDVYLDPAGHGWMTSAIAPVYQGDFLEGVVGIDVTVSTITQTVLNLDFPWNGYGLLLGKDGTILALPEAGESDWNLDEITDHHYQEAIMQDTFKPLDFNLYNRQDLQGFPAAVAQSDTGTANLTLKNESKVASWATIKQTGWKLVIIVPQAAVFAGVNQMQDSLSQIGFYSLAAFIVLNMLLFAAIIRYAKTTGDRIANPLQAINAIVRQIGEGQYDQTAPDISVHELQETAETIVQMGHQLDEAMSSNAILQTANNLKSEFIANMSHEIRTPVHAILGYTSLLRETTSESRQVKYIDTVQKAGTNLLTIINGILDLSKLEAGMIDLQPEPFDLRSMLLEIQELYAYDCERKGIQFTLSQDPDLPESIVLDELRLRQILVNLVGNATKFTEHGSIKLSARAFPQTERPAGSPDPDRTTLVLSVQDSGIGIPRNQIKRIFEPFRQKDGQSSRKYGGTGLGLAIVQRFVDLMNGKIQVDSSEGQGTIFTVTLPDVPVGKKPDMDVPQFDFDRSNPSSGATGLSRNGNIAIKSPVPVQPAHLQPARNLYEPLSAILLGPWQRCKNSGRVHDYQTFLSALQELSGQQGDLALQHYRESLSQAIESFDIGQMQQLAQKYPELVAAAKAEPGPGGSNPHG
ncbi:MAG: hypothetical protein EOM08_08655 [Clostridia bacterium]|nr:hypothetical protein [Clostridia bacterium]NCC76487.1 hypothetical protein [Clostridia bacterium]